MNKLSEIKFSIGCIVWLWLRLCPNVSTTQLRQCFFFGMFIFQLDNTKYCRHLIAVMGVVDMFGLWLCQDICQLLMRLINEATMRLYNYIVVQWIFDLRKFLGTAKNFLKSKIFLKSNTPSSLKYANWKYYSYFYDPIY